ncbi:MAG TPA: dihydrodipicolinate synthase family protein [Chloroflexi bacterium]|nr:dihydrodipicolinate synthase family protein [Chloroflexota bacterium]
MMPITGVYPPIATPFDADGRLDAAALADNVACWNETGLDGYVVAGSNGENVLLDADEVVEAVRVVRRAALPDQRVIAGTGLQSTAATIRLTRAAAEAGADTVLVLTPSFYSGEMTPAAFIAHYQAVADASPVPVLLYNVPKFTHVNISPATVAQLAGHENIVGIKDSAGDIAQIIEFLRLCPPEFSVILGNGPAFLSGLQAGAVGGILALANVAPRECVAIHRLLSEGRVDEARKIHFRMMPVGRAVTSQFGIAGLKAALDILGYYGGPPRRPLLPADDATHASIRNILSEAGLLD